MPDVAISGAAPARRRGRGALLIVLALIAVAVMLLGPSMLDRFALNVLTRAMIFAMLAITVDLLWGFTGILTFGQAAFFGVGAYATAMILTHLGDSAPYLALGLLAAIVVPTLVGAAVGWLTFYPGSSAFYATIISLVVPIVITQLIYSGGTWTGSSSGLVGYWGMALSLEGYFRLVGVVLVVMTVAALVFVRSDAGRLLTAIRNNEMRCAYLGIGTQRIKILLTAVLAGATGLAGFLYANASGVVAPENAGFVFGTELVVWTALGGRGTIVGPVLGAVGIGYLSAELSGHYKPDPEVYIKAADLLGLPHEKVMMVAAHRGDLRAAGALGFKTAFVPRPLEYGPDREIDTTPDPAFDVNATDFVDLAAQL